MVKTVKKYKWHEKSVCSYYVEEKTGRIVGTISTQSFSDDIHHARVNGDNLGEYISEKQAMKAVEDKIAEIDAADEAWRNTSLGKGVL
jgi:hypothetical protein